MSTSVPVSGRIVIQLATPEDRNAIYEHRHTVYALELGQHAANAEGRLTDPLDAYNFYVAALLDGEVVGFISITPPGQPRYSIDKYFARSELPFAVDDGLYEVRLLTIVPRYRGGERGGEIAGLLIYAAFRWVEVNGGRRIMAIGRREVLGLYRRVGLQPLGRQIQSGSVTYELLTASVAELREQVQRYAISLRQLEPTIDWQLGLPFSPSPGCFHGGAAFETIGDEFGHLDRIGAIISADVLDAWFPPSPRVLAALSEHLPWILHTAPPVLADGLARVIARTRGVGPENVLTGAGSSQLIYLAFRHWLTAASRVLILDPMYGEYAYVLEQILHCSVTRLPLARTAGYVLEPARLLAAFAVPHDLIVLVNPNNPTGRLVPRDVLAEMLRQIPKSSRVWIDEAYIDYAGPDQSLEGLAARSRNIVVCKSISKVYALSGLRAAYLCGPATLLEELRLLLPPYAVSLPAQLAGVKAMQDADYYRQRYHETKALRNELTDGLREIGFAEVVPGVANFLLAHLPEAGPHAAAVVAQCRTQGLLLRNVQGVGSGLGMHALRLAVKDRDSNRRMLAILARVLRQEDERSVRIDTPTVSEV
jgi:histidinol-phosphate/aromatic aminotransferase/cobyric acid decarboxylase-like protein